MTSVSPSAEMADQQQFIPKSKRKLQKHLRSAGLAYISRTGRLIPAKKVAEELCQCPHKCDELVPMESRRRLFTHFYSTLADADLQNRFLRTNMDLRARLNIPESTGSGRPPRRITCKYLVPLLDEGKSVEVCQKAFVSAFVITTKRVRLQREKLISSLGLNSYSSHNRSKKDQQQLAQAQQTKQDILENNNNIVQPSKYPLSLPSPQTMPLNLSLSLLNTSCEAMNGSTSSKVPKNRYTPPPSKRSKKNNDDPLIPFGLVMPEGVTIAPVMANADHDRDIAIVNNFFNNQLWKPEYIGAS